MQDTKQLSPAELARKMVEHAKKVEQQQAWAQYEAEQARFKEVRTLRYPSRAEHGTLTLYKAGCSCEECRRAVREYQREYRAKKQKPAPAPRVQRVRDYSITDRVAYVVRDDQHGTHTGYVYGCRCEACKQAHRDWTAARRPQKIVDETPHGTSTSYREGCRCQPCKDAVNAGRNHGVPQTYRKGCRCLKCRTAWNSYKLPQNRARRDRLKSV